MPHHDRKAIEMCCLSADECQGIIAGVEKRRAEKQVFCGITAKGQFGCHHHLSPLCVGLVGGLDDPAGIALHISHHKIQLGQTDFE